MTFTTLMTKDYINQSYLQDRRIHDMLTLTYRALNGNSPVYIKNLLNERDTQFLQPTWPTSSQCPQG